MEAVFTKARNLVGKATLGALLLSGSASTYAVESTDTIHFLNLSSGCKAHLEFAFADKISRSANNLIELQLDTQLSESDEKLRSEAIEKTIQGKNGYLILTKPTNQSSGIMVIPDTRLPCRTNFEIGRIPSDIFQNAERLETGKRPQEVEISASYFLPKNDSAVLVGSAFSPKGIEAVTANGDLVELNKDGSFRIEKFIPSSGLSINLVAIDSRGHTTNKRFDIKRTNSALDLLASFEPLQPVGEYSKKNINRYALVIGVETYDKVPASAVFAEKDAKYFNDFAHYRLGIPRPNIKVLLNKDATRTEILLALKRWLPRQSLTKNPDIFLFFAGHGLASLDGEEMFVLPHDGTPDLLSETALATKDIFEYLANLNPNTISVFVDTCYSGTARGSKQNIVSNRPIIVGREIGSLPSNVILMTASGPNEAANALQEAEHGLFSYFLMKGMEGIADRDENNEITAGELHTYINANVVQQSSGSQSPQFWGDEDRVLVELK